MESSPNRENSRGTTESRVADDDVHKHGEEVSSAEDAAAAASSVREPLGRMTSGSERLEVETRDTDRDRETELELELDRETETTELCIEKPQKTDRVMSDARCQMSGLMCHVSCVMSSCLLCASVCHEVSVTDDR